MQAEVVYSGSMSPMLERGYLILVKPTPAGKLKVGDVITFNDPREGKGPDDYVTHRIHRTEMMKGERVFITKGDANQDVDPFVLKLKDQAGLYQFKVPYAGYLSFLVRSKAGYVMLIAIPALLLLILLLMKVWSSPAKPEDGGTQEGDKGTDAGVPEIIDFSAGGTWQGSAMTPAQQWPVPPAATGHPVGVGDGAQPHPVAHETEAARQAG